MSSFKLKVKDYNDDGRIVTIAEKEFYNLDGIKSAADWVREPIKGIKTFDAPQVNSPINIKQSGRGKICHNALGYMHNNSNSVQFNAQLVGMYSSCFSSANGLSILPSNFNRVVALFTARKLIESNWMTQQDQYMVPNESHPNYSQFVNDSIVFCLFNNKSNQSSLRQISYKEKSWDIHNHFFWMSVADIQSLAISNNFNNLYNHTIGKKDSYVYTLLKNTVLSPDAKNILDMATSLIKLSFPLRQVAHQVNPEYHLNAWDAGWYQIRNGILKQHFPSQYKEFNDSFKQFSDRLRPLVYQLGFLKP